MRCHHGGRPARARLGLHGIQKHPASRPPAGRRQLRLRVGAVGEEQHGRAGRLGGGDGGDNGGGELRPPELPPLLRRHARAASRKCARSLLLLYLQLQLLLLLLLCLCL